MSDITKAASAMGKKGGSATSPAKAKASRENGRYGGRKLPEGSKIARVFEDLGGYFVCDDALPYLDNCGPAYRTKADALRAARLEGYTHATGIGTYWSGVRAIPFS